MKDIIKKAIIVGSAPISRNLRSVDLDGYHKIAINKSWRIRRDFDSHVYLRSLSEEDMPPLASGLESIGVREFTPNLNSAGGLYLTSGSVAMIAGYWSVASLGLGMLSYYGCDLVFSGNPDERTHYYGTGDQGPLVGNFEYNLRQHERSIRLLCWGLMHRVVITNSSALEGSLLAFPKMPLHIDNAALIYDILSSKEVLRLIRKASNIWTFEYQTRTPAFNDRQKIFEKDPDALAAMNQMMDEWLALESFLQDYVDRVAELTSAADKGAGAGRATSPAQYLERQNAPFDLVVYVGAVSGASSVIQNHLDSGNIDDETCKVVPRRELKNFYSKLAGLLAEQTSKDSVSQWRNVQIVKNFSKRLFDGLDIQSGQRVLISEESALGNSAQCGFSGKLFPSPNKVLSNFAANLPSEPSEIHVSISRYTEFFAWAYLDFLKSTRSTKYISPDLMVAKVMAHLPSWGSTLDSVAQCFPSSEIHVWCMDDLQSATPGLLKALIAGSDKAGLHLPDVSSLTTGPQHKAQFDQFMADVQQSGLDVALENWCDIRTASPTVVRTFDPWSSDQKKHLDQLYARDLDLISKDTRFMVRHSITKGRTQ